MLDKRLCAIFGIDEFNQWIMKELDSIEDQLYASTLPSSQHAELQIRYQTLKDVRNAYWIINKMWLKVKSPIVTEVAAAEKDNSVDASTYKFEITIFDQQDDPSRFYTLTHHFDYLCPVDLYPDVIVCDVTVELCVCNFGYKVTVKGYATGERALELLSAADLTDWGRATIISNNATKIQANIEK